MSWLPPRPDAPERAELTPWLPPVILSRLGETLVLRDELSYIVVDEIDDRAAGMVVAPWPVVDDKGRVVFADEDVDVHVVVARDALQALLRDRRLVSGAQTDRQEQALRERPIRIGDVFAARVAMPRAVDDDAHVAADDDDGDLTTWIEGAILDITAEGLELARMQASAAAAGAVDASFLDHVAAELRGEEPPDAGPPARLGGTPRGGAPAAPAAPAGDTSVGRLRADPRVGFVAKFSNLPRFLAAARDVRRVQIEDEALVDRDELVQPSDQPPMESA